MYSKQTDLYRNTLLQFCKFEIIEKIKTANELINFGFKDKKNMLPIEKISIGTKAKECISKFSTNEKQLFLEGVSKFNIKLCAATEESRIVKFILSKLRIP